MEPQINVLVYIVLHYFYGKQRDSRTVWLQQPQKASFELQQWIRDVSEHQVCLWAKLHRETIFVCRHRYKRPASSRHPNAEHCQFDRNYTY